MNYYFLGIGGIGMSALARYFKQRGDSVAGYDHTESPLTQQLQSEGIAVHYDDNPSKIPHDIDLCIYTPAVPTTTAEYQYIASHGIEIRKRSQVLGELTRGTLCIAVAGSHGKTTTTAMIAHLLHTAGERYNTFLGGIGKNLGSNMHCEPGARYTVVEADEYDRSFLQLHPHIAVITATDPDHLDIYGTHDAMLDAFEQFACQTDGDGHVIIKNSASLLSRQVADAFEQRCSADIRCYSAENDTTRYHAQQIEVREAGQITFDLTLDGHTINNIELNHSALYNVENAVAACAVARLCGLDDEAIRQGMRTFAGVLRRFDYRINNRRIVYIDDYAHHPKELAASIGSARKLFAGKTITGIFQPHLYSRTADFYKEFAAALDALDRVILLDIYPARERPIEGVTSALILQQMTNRNKQLCSNSELLALLPNLETDVLMTLGAGDIDRLVPEIEKIYNTL